MVNFVRLFEDVIFDAKSLQKLSKKKKKEAFLRKYDRDVSDHLPIWIRLPLPSLGQPEL